MKPHAVPPGPTAPPPSASRLRPSPRLIVVAAVLLFKLPASACDGCNLLFADQVLTGDRADTLVGRDLRRAMENQRNLPLAGFSNPDLVIAQNNKLPAVSQSTPVSTAPAPARMPLPAGLRWPPPRFCAGKNA